MPGPKKSARGSGEKSPPAERGDFHIEHEDGFEVGNLDFWNMAFREFIRNSINLEGDTQAKTELFEYLADKSVSFRSFALVAGTIMCVTKRFGNTCRMLHDAFGGKKFPPMRLPKRVEIVILSDSSLSIGKNDSSKVSLGEIIG